MKLYNTLSRTESTVAPLQDTKISMYSCGPTVYDETHIGHMRKFTMDDVLKRALTYQGYDVKHVMNITDVGHLSGDDDSGEDKLEKGAKKHGKTVWDVAKYYTDRFFETMDALNIIRPDIVPKATEHIPQMIKLIEKLEEKGFTYETDEAVYFDVMKFKSYGQLSGQKLEDKMQGARAEVNVDSKKKHPADFALWFKRVGRFADHTMHWESPWGDGFPGWHIECSAMSMEYLGEQIDIHTGGIDHIPVHHENEIAQSEAATGKKFVNHWVHHAFLKVNGEKMSKSKGNFYTLKDLQDHNIDPLAMRYLFLQTHYRQEMNFTWEAVEAASKGLQKLWEKASVFHERNFDLKSQRAPSRQILEGIKHFNEAINDDLNFPKAIGILHEHLNQDIDDHDVLFFMTLADPILGLDLIKKGKELSSIDIPDVITHLAHQRKDAKLAKNFQKADDLRKRINDLGYEIEDMKDGYTIKKLS